MKASSSPSPLHQISIICFKKCPFLRTYLRATCEEIWATKEIPSIRCNATTILIYKKGDTNDPSNFRPITLEPVALKVLTSLIRDRIYSFLASNNYIETEIQEGFVPGMSGTYEHIANLSYLINHARKKQKSLTITLIDLRNAFGEVHHNLIDTILEYHHVDQQVRDIVKLLYRDFYTSIITDAFTSDFIKILKGVLQGDCLSPLLFNLVINTFIQHIKQNHYNQLGYKFLAELIPRHWFQFADDAAVVSCLAGK